MKHKKHNENEEDLKKAADKTDKISDNETAPDAAKAADQEVKKTYTEEEYQAKVNELNDKYMRLYSEFDNFRKRTFREKIDMSRSASEEVIKEMLPVLDDFDRALLSMKDTDKVEAVKEGVEHISSKLKSILNAKGLKEIASVGQPFDTDFHEAVTSIPAPADDMKNKVVDEIQKGYMLNDKVIRFAKVVTGS